MASTCTTLSFSSLPPPKVSFFDSWVFRVFIFYLNNNKNLYRWDFDLWVIIGFGGSLNLGAVLDFVDSGHDLILAADSSPSDLIRNVATEFGVDFDEV